ncbi:hypothetical protein PF005_g3118 [Phytophthora fragariae]|uniref:Uncharacterized protein n=1 Tax=Phytophthora fragariae TaxID=53985 RepID=A0A6A3L8V9_9STRA|nr:hypothetical protein PF003_g39128 [Phytophthora fragariae]KAE8932404.1 hypothetical protein PF009_g17559 [Phytophthora fragariae]KAE9014605.1 hypothetical protein PF011_g7972 [Phytophthora fragariae]KAE9128662.1 hypothetical protein PF007_g5191 [Phytophthora fragariae]KAE9146871.1 hypothetical protein PF006_g8401 [Phytophthora fragariae]
MQCLASPQALRVGSLLGASRAAAAGEALAHVVWRWIVANCARQGSLLVILDAFSVSSNVSASFTEKPIARGVHRSRLTMLGVGIGWWSGLLSFGDCVGSTFGCQ